MEDRKQHVSIVIAGHPDSGKSTSVGHLMFELGGIAPREMEKLKNEANTLGKSSFCFAFYMDTTKEERERGITIQCTTKEFFTSNYHYTIIDAPGHRDFIKNMITGASQADVALLMVPADGNFITSIARGNHKEGEVQGQTRQHARLLNLLGIKQLIVGINKMDSDTAKYSEERFNEVKNEMANMLIRVGWTKTFVEKSVTFLPISGWKGDNLIKKSENMPWWKGQDVKSRSGKMIHVETLLEALDILVHIPKRDPDANLRMPCSGVHKIAGIGDVITGRIEQGSIKPGDEVVFLPSHTSSNPCTGKVFSIEMHHKSVPNAGPGDNVGLNVKGLNKSYLPKSGDIIVLKNDTSLKAVTKMVCSVQILEHPGELKVGYTPSGHIRTARSPLKMTKINWKMGKETGNQKLEDPPFIKANEMAEVIFEPTHPFCCEPFDKCEGLGRLAIMDGNSVVMLGKVTSVE